MKADERQIRGSSTITLLAALLWVGVAMAARGGAGSNEWVSGVTEPLQDVTLSASVPGIIGKRFFNEGDPVKEGDRLVELDKRLEELEVSRRKLVMDNRKTDLEATKALFEKGKVVSKEELDKREVEYAVATVEHDIAVEQLRRRHVASPFVGTIAELTLHVGEACQPYQALVRVVDISRCYLVCNIQASAAARLKMDQTVKLEIETGTGAVAVQGKITFISPVADQASGLLRVKALFDNSAGKIRPGLAGRMWVD